MSDILLVCRRTNSDAARSLSSELAQLAAGQGLAVSELNPMAWLGVGGPHPPKITTIANWTLIGDVFNRRSPDLPATSPHDPWAYERKLLARVWGRFIGVQFGAGDQATALLRDPSGALECVAWTHEDLTIVSSSALEWLIRRLRPRWRINVPRLAQALRDPVPETGPLLVEGPVALHPGTAQPLPLPASPEVIWSPGDIARRSLVDWPPPEEASDLLRQAIDDTVAQLADISSPLAAEVSGGLDSSIVASSLARHDRASVKLWINAYGATEEADERHFVAALGRTLGIDALSVPHVTAPMDEAWLVQISNGYRPGLNALDRPHDLDWRRRLSASGVKGLMTGRGGDTILLQRANGDVFTDLWRARGWRSLWSADAHELAASNEVSMWSLAHQARRHRNHRPLRSSHPMLPPLPAAFPPHPWLEGRDAFGPAKAFQIAGLADSVSRHGPSELSRAIDVRNPLCAQPVIEACLALPAPLLTAGGRDRGLARRAFSGRIPLEIIDRRSKGDMTRVYGRMIHANLDFFRPWLVEGRLAALGVIDADAADRELTREALLWHGNYGALILAAAFEGWVRVWEGLLDPSR